MRFVKDIDCDRIAPLCINSKDRQDADIFFHLFSKDADSEWTVDFAAFNSNNKGVVYIPFSWRDNIIGFLECTLSGISLEIRTKDFTSNEFTNSVDAFLDTNGLELEDLQSIESFMTVQYGYDTDWFVADCSCLRATVIIDGDLPLLNRWNITELTKGVTKQVLDGIPSREEYENKHDGIYITDYAINNFLIMRNKSGVDHIICIQCDDAFYRAEPFLLLDVYDLGSLESCKLLYLDTEDEIDTTKPIDLKNADFLEFLDDITFNNIRDFDLLKTYAFLVIDDDNFLYTLVKKSDRLNVFFENDLKGLI